MIARTCDPIALSAVPVPESARNISQCFQKTLALNLHIVSYRYYCTTCTFALRRANARRQSDRLGGSARNRAQSQVHSDIQVRVDLLVIRI